MTNVTLYGLPAQACRQCWSTERVMEKHNVQAKKVRLDQDPAAMERVKALGYLEAPVVVVERDGEVIDHWGGFRIDRIKALKEV